LYVAAAARALVVTAVLLCIKPCSFFLARRILERKMALTLLGKSTLHGRSSIVHLAHAARTRRPKRGSAKHLPRFLRKQPKARNLKQPKARNWWRKRAKPADVSDDDGRATDGRVTDAEMSVVAEASGVDGRGSDATERGSDDNGRAATRAAVTRAPTAAKRRMLTGTRKVSDRFVLDAAFDQYGFSDERKKVIARDFAVSHLQYAHLFTKMIVRSYRFFVCVVLFQLFAILPRHVVEQTDSGTRDTSALPFRASWIFVEPLNTSALAGEGSCQVCPYRLDVMVCELMGRLPRWEDHFESL
jgi:hypothetical protein